MSSSMIMCTFLVRSLLMRANKLKNLSGMYMCIIPVRCDLTCRTVHLYMTTGIYVISSQLGTHKDLLQREGLYAELIRRQTVLQ